MRRFQLPLLIAAILAAFPVFGDPPTASTEQSPPAVPVGKVADGSIEPAFGLQLSHRPAEARILAALATRDNFRYSKSSLNKLAEDIERRFDIEVQIDGRALNDASIPENLEMSIDLHDVALVSALNNVLRYDKLSWAIWDESLWITTDGEASQHLTVLIYDVADLSTTDGDDASFDFDPLTDVISTTIAPNAWDTVGGSGSIAPFSCAGLNVLVISQTWQVHLQIGKMLTDLRSIKKNGGPSARVRPSEKTGKLSDNSSKSLVRAKDNDSQPDNGETLTDTSLIEGNNQFAFDLYQKLRDDPAGKDSGNLFFSPYSISTAMGMAYEGSRGNTADEIAKVLHFKASPSELAKDFSRLNKTLRPPTLAIDKFRSANRLWGDARFPFENSYVETIKREYEGDLEIVDFKQPSNVVARINAWVSKETEGMIPSAIAEDALYPAMPFVLVNAVYFHGKWKSPFSSEATKAGDFQGFDRRHRVQLMHAQLDLNYVSDSSVQVLELPYQDSQMSFVVLLPKRGRELFAELEEQLQEKLDDLLKRLQKREVMVVLPKFVLQQQLRLEQPLASLGMQRAFDERLADFTGIASQQLWIAALFHQAKVEVDEQGTRAAAVTGGAFGGAPTRPTLFQADRPFIFLIRHRPTGQIVFLGRLTRPHELPN